MTFSITDIELGIAREIGICFLQGRTPTAFIKCRECGRTFWRITFQQGKTKFIFYW